MKTKAFLNNQVQKKMQRDALYFGPQYLPPMGYANGYVAVPPEHPLYGKGYDDVDIDAWGGLTLAAVRSDCKWDAEHIEMIDGGSFADIPQDWWVFGFDTMHFDDGPEHNREWCICETKHLQQQLETLRKED